MFFKIDALKNLAIFTKKHLCWRLFWIKLHQVCNFEETPTQMLSCEYCQIFRSTFFRRTPTVTASCVVLRNRFTEKEKAIIQKNDAFLSKNEFCHKYFPRICRYTYIKQDVRMAASVWFLLIFNKLLEGIAYSFHFTFPHFNPLPCLLDHVVVYAKLEVIIWRNMRLFSWRDKIWFFL